VRHLRGQHARRGLFSTPCIIMWCTKSNIFIESSHRVDSIPIHGSSIESLVLYSITFKSKFLCTSTAFVKRKEGGDFCNS
jgi:hypothetical protein